MSHPSIPLTKGQFALVDALDFAWLIQRRWCCNNKGYAVHYATFNGIRQVQSMHREIMAHILGRPIPTHLQVDHINGNRLDNRRENLRLATRSQNQANKGTPTNNTSGYKGVSWRAGKWEARLRHHHRLIHLGRFQTEIEAALAYAAATRLLNADFAQADLLDCPTPPAIALTVSQALLKRGLLKRGLLMVCALLA